MTNSWQWGPSIRRARILAGQSQRDAARHVGVSAGYLSKIERGLSSPTITLLDKIASTYGVPLPLLLADKVERHSRISLAEHRQRARFDDSAMEHEPLFADPNRVIQAYIRYVEGRRQVEKPPISHSQTTDEFFMVLDGSLRLAVGSDNLVLKSHDAIYLLGGTPHRVLEGLPSACYVVVLATAHQPAGRISGLT